MCLERPWLLIKQEPLYHSFAQTLQKMGGFESSPTLAVAVSGGADSLALTFLANQWVKDHQGQLIAIHVDHGLRSSSATEAETLQEWMDQQRISYHILKWHHSGISSALQHQAREARYQLLTQKCQDLKILHLLVAHHQEDQFETFFLRLLRGSGIKGLAAMPFISEKNSLRILRPLLTHSKQDLISFLQKVSHPYIEDPSNQNETFSRVKIRHLLSFMKEKELDASGISTSLCKLQQANDILETQALHILAHESYISPFGYATLSHKAFDDLPTEVGCRILGKLIQCIGGNPYPPRHESLQALYTEFLCTRLSQGKTCGGCYLKSSREMLWIIREPVAVQAAHRLQSTENFQWDSRFFVDKVQEKALYFNIRVQMLGRTGQIQLKQMSFPLPNIPTIVQQTLPALWIEETVVSVPILGIEVETKFQDLVRIRFSPRHSVGRSIPCSSYT